jgi:SAM-dependent methyltransferase
MGVHWRLSATSSVDYHPCDLSPEQYAFANDLRRIDLTNLPYPDASFDVVLANHVLEHVADNARALAEIHRVLRPGGWAMLQVPIAHKLEHTREDASVTSPCERERLFGQRDHVRLYGRNYPDRLARRRLLGRALGRPHARRWQRLRDLASQPTQSAHYRHAHD